MLSAPLSRRPQPPLATSRPLAPPARPAACTPTRKVSLEHASALSTPERSAVGLCGPPVGSLPPSVVTCRRPFPPRACRVSGPAARRSPLAARRYLLRYRPGRLAVQVQVQAQLLASCWCHHRLRPTTRGGLPPLSPAVRPARVCPAASRSPRSVRGCLSTWCSTGVQLCRSELAVELRLRASRSRVRAHARSCCTARAASATAKGARPAGQKLAKGQNVTYVTFWPALLGACNATLRGPWRGSRRAAGPCAAAQHPAAAASTPPAHAAAPATPAAAPKQLGGPNMPKSWFLRQWPGWR